MTRILRRFARGDDGQAMVEFALVLPILLILLIGIIEFGRAWNEHLVITDAAREAARKAAVNNPAITLDSIKNVAKSALQRAGVNPANATINAPNWDGGTGTDLTVTIALPYRFTFFGPLVKWSTGKRDITLTTAFVMRNE